MGWGGGGETQQLSGLPVRCRRPSGKALAGERMDGNASACAYIIPPVVGIAFTGAWKAEKWEMGWKWAQEPIRETYEIGWR